MKTNPSDPAGALMPSHTDPNKIRETDNAGLSKREYFAAMALQGLVSKDYGHLTIDDPDELQRAISSTAVEMADALIHQLNL